MLLLEKASIQERKKVLLINGFTSDRSNHTHKLTVSYDRTNSFIRLKLLVPRRETNHSYGAFDFDYSRNKKQCDGKICRHTVITHCRHRINTSDSNHYTQKGDGDG